MNELDLDLVVDKGAFDSMWASSLNLRRELLNKDDKSTVELSWLLSIDELIKEIGNKQSSKSGQAEETTVSTKTVIGFIKKGLDLHERLGEVVFLTKQKEEWVRNFEIYASLVLAQLMNNNKESLLKD